MKSTAHIRTVGLAGGTASESGFYLVFAVMSALLVSAGFGRSYYLKMYFNTPSLPILFHFHGAIFTTWVLFFVCQTWLVWDGRFKFHRQMGLAGTVLAAMMFILGVAMAFVSGSMGHFHAIPGAATPAEACLFSLFDISLFAGFVWAGFLWRSNSEVHSRLMLLSMAIPLLPSAIGRMCSFKPTIAAPIILAFILAGPVYDLATRHRIHRTYVVGLIVFLMTAPPVRILLGRTELWRRVFSAVMSLTGS